MATRHLTGDTLGLKRQSSMSYKEYADDMQVSDSDRCIILPRVDDTVLLTEHVCRADQQSTDQRR